MNEEIKKLIKEQAENYSERIKKNTSFKSNERIAAAAGFTRGAIIISEIILSKWQEAERWRKVEEELPEVNREPYHILVKSKVGYQIIIICNYGAGISYQMEYFGVTEWKPIS